MRELIMAVRRLRLQPGFAVAAISTLALGMAAPTALYAVVKATLLEPLPCLSSEAPADGIACRFVRRMVAVEPISSLPPVFWQRKDRKSWPHWQEEPT